MRIFSKKVIVAIAVSGIVGLLFHYASPLTVATRKAAMLSAELLLPDGWGYTASMSPLKVSISEETSSFEKDDMPTESTVSLSPTPPKGVPTGTIETTTLSLTAANTKAEGVHVSNKTGKSVNLNTYLKQGMPFSLTDTAKPQVLIVHTHATESYTSGDYGYYVKSASTRSTDNTQNTVHIGDVMAAVLNEAGIATINDTTKHDYPEYTGSYTRSAKTISDYLEKYPSIKVVIDLHRDAIAQDNGVKIKPTAKIHGKNAAQIMILAGCETGSVEDFPHWEDNFRFCLLLQRQIEADYPGLARPMLFKACKYNFNMLTGSILIEVGTDANTLEEAEYSAKLLGQALRKLLKL